MSNNTNTPLSEFAEFEKSAYKFLEELKNIRINIQLLPASEAKKANRIVSCIKNMMSCVRKDIEKDVLNKK